MKQDASSDNLKSTTLGWKFLAIVTVISCIFFTFLYMAMSHEPDYMIERKQKLSTEHNSQSSTPKTEEKVSTE